MERIKKGYRFLIYILPATLFFSYYPVISLGASESMNFELSLPLLWLVIFDVVVLYLLIKKRALSGIWKNWKWLLFPIFVTLSVFWSMNFLRGLLTVGVLWLLYFAGYAFWNLKSLFLEVGFKERFWKVFFGSALVVCGWCLAQCILDLAGVPREGSLMCAGCTYRMFGFPHPNGFAIEPQFMGNLLLAPAIMAGYMLETKAIFAKDALKGVRSSLRPLVSIVLVFVLSATLFLTFSRGAIYAFVMAVIFMVAVEGVRQKTWRVCRTFLVVAGAFVFTLNLQGIMAQVGPTDDTYGSGVAKALNHLSLGVVDIRSDINEGEEDVLEEQNVPMLEEVEGHDENEGEQAVFDGYVEESTDTRVRLSNAAVEVWRKDFGTMLFGVGIGGAGQALYANGLSPAPKEIIQNEYASLLLETGLIGVVLLILTIILIVRAAMKSVIAPVILTLTVAYAITLLFFSGLPNALHIYLLPALFISLYGNSLYRKQ